MVEDLKTEERTPVRSTALKVSIMEITEGEFVKSESQWEPSYVLTPKKEKVSRARVLGNVVSRFVDDENRYGSITLDDGSDTISARTFKEDIERMGDIKLGDIVDVIGKVREYGDEKYINMELARIIKDPNWELVRKLELLLKRKLPGKAEMQKAKEEGEKEEKVEVAEEVVEEDLKVMVTGLIEELDEGDGVKYATILKEGNLNDEELEGILNELMSDGEIYEPKIGRFKKV